MQSQSHSCCQTKKWEGIRMAKDSQLCPLGLPGAALAARMGGTQVEGARPPSHSHWEGTGSGGTRGPPHHDQILPPLQPCQYRARCPCFTPAPHSPTAPAQHQASRGSKLWIHGRCSALFLGLGRLGSRGRFPAFCKLGANPTRTCPCRSPEH